jgi:hypothetical protein
MLPDFIIRRLQLGILLFLLLQCVWNVGTTDDIIRLRQRRHADTNRIPLRKIKQQSLLAIAYPYFLKG